MNKTPDKIPDKTVILHWIESQSMWTELPWADWVRFRGLDQDQTSVLLGAEAGEHYFVVCMLGRHGDLWNVVPHRYVITNDARLVHGFDGLDLAEREESDRLRELTSPTIEDIERYTELGTRGFAVNLPPSHTVQPLLLAMPGLAGAGLGAACWEFLSAIGICQPTSRPN
jgi:hypothetical protein